MIYWKRKVKKIYIVYFLFCFFLKVELMPVYIYTCTQLNPGIIYHTYTSTSTKIMVNLTCLCLYFIQQACTNILFFSDHENGVRSDSPPTQTLKSSFRPIHDR